MSFEHLQHHPPLSDGLALAGTSTTRWQWQQVKVSLSRDSPGP